MDKNSTKLNYSVSTLDELIEELHVLFSGDSVNVDQIYALMRSYKSNPAEWRKYAVSDRNKYTRNLVNAGNGKFNLMILCWGEGHGSSIHDHADSHCFMKMLEGELTELRYDWPTESQENEEMKPLVPCSKAILDLNNVCYINDSLGLHRVENSSHTNPAVSLHLYCPPFDACSMFDQRTGHRTKCPVTFWTKYGEKVRYLGQEIVPENN
jgi:cysteine dioxygenase